MARPKSFSIEDTNGRPWRLLQAIHDFKQAHDYSPSYRDLMNAVGITSTGMLGFYCNGLRNLGYVDFIEKQSRTIHLTEKGKLLFGSKRKTWREQKTVNTALNVNTTITRNNLPTAG